MKKVYVVGFGVHESGFRAFVFIVLGRVFMREALGWMVQGLRDRGIFIVYGKGTQDMLAVNLIHSLLRLNSFNAFCAPALSPFPSLCQAVKT